MLLVVVLKNAEMQNISALCRALDDIATHAKASNDTLRKLRATQLILEFVAADELYCDRDCLRSEFERNFATLLDLVEEDLFGGDTDTQSDNGMTQFLGIARCDDANSSAVSMPRIRGDERGARGEENAQNVLDIGSVMLNKTSDAMCESLEFHAMIASELLSRIAAQSFSESLNGNVVYGVAVSAGDCTKLRTILCRLRG